MRQSYEIEIKSLLGSKERQQELRARLEALDPNFHLLEKSKRLNHYFVGGDLGGLFRRLLNRVDTAKIESFKKITTDFEEKNCSIRSKWVNPVRSSRGALNPAFAKADQHSSPWQATGRSASNGVNGKVSLVIKAAIGEGNSVHGEARLEFDSLISGLSFEELDQAILDVGFKYQAKWSEEREEYQFRDMRVTLDFSPGYGYMAEFEIVSNSAESIFADKAKLKATMKELGVEEVPNERIERMFEFYNANWQDYYGTDKVFVIE